MHPSIEIVYGAFAEVLLEYFAAFAAADAVGDGNIRQTNGCLVILPDKRCHFATSFHILMLCGRQYGFHCAKEIRGIKRKLVKHSSYHPM